MKTIKITERPDLKTSEILNLLRDKFPVWSYYDDEKLDKEFPAPTEATIAEFLDSVEPDQDTLGDSVNEVLKKYPNKQGITVRQRLLLELAYFDLYGTHMDIKGVTFCSGSRNSNGSVPCVFFDDDKVEVGWYDLDDAYARYGVRSAVSLNSLNFDPSENQLDDVITKAIETLKSRGFTITKEF